MSSSTEGVATPIKVRPFRNESLIIRLTIAGLVLCSVCGFLTFDYRSVSFLEGVQKTAENFRVMIAEAHFSHFTFGEALYAVLITFGLAFLTTLFGAIISVFLGLLAARNLTNSAVSNVIKGFVAVIRAIPTVLWVLIFAVSAGLGSVAAVIGMTFHTVSYLVKAYSEAFEELDEGVIEALKGSGASWSQIVFQAVIPSSITYMISWTFFRFEINFGNAIAMGAAAGAGGIGFEMFMASSFYFDIREMGTITMFILAFAVALEMIATRMKARLRSRG